MSMEKSTVDYHLTLEGTKFPGTEITIKKIMVDFNTIMLSLYTPVLHVDSNLFSDFFQSYVDDVLPKVNDTDYMVRVVSLVSDGGVKADHFGVDILSASLNLIPTFTRHGIVIPNKVTDLQVYIDGGAFKLHEESVDLINKMLDQLKAQRNVPKTINHMFNTLKRGSLKVPTSRTTPDTVDIDYVLPEEAEVDVVSVPTKGFRLMGKIDLNGGLIEYHVVDPIDFEEKKSRMKDPEDIIHLITSELRRHIFRYKIDLGEIPRSGYYKFTGI